LKTSKLEIGLSNVVNDTMSSLIYQNNGYGFSRLAPILRPHTLLKTF